MTEPAAALAAWLPRLVALDHVAEPVVVACSGGTDSLALLALARAVELDVVAVYVDHGLRAGTAHEAELVRAAAGRFGARAEAVAVGVGAGPNLEARARAARYDALEQVRRRHGAGAVLVGHTRDDQAETILLNLMRGSGLPGLSGMREVSGAVRRPLLALRRADTTEICARLALVPSTDPMNGDARHRRVWLRREVLPLLSAGADRDVVEVLARQAAVMREDDDLLEDLARDALERARPPGRREELDAARLAELPVALARRAVRAWLGPPPPALDTVDAVLAVARGEVAAALGPGNRRIERAGGRLHLVTSAGSDSAAPGVDDGETVEGEAVELPLPGAAALGATRVEAWIEHAPPVAWPDGRSTCVLDADACGPGAVLRGAQAGERIRPLGLHGTKVVFDALAEIGVPASARPSAPVVAAGAGAAVAAGCPLWVVDYRIDDRVRVTTRTRRFLWLTARDTVAARHGAMR